MAATLTPLSDFIGIEIRGLAAAELASSTEAERCLGALDAYGVVVYPEIDVSDADLVAFSHLLGDVVANPTHEHEFPEIATITLDPNKTDTMLARYREGNFLWHIDGATDEVPQRATVLTARVVDEAGGDTEFASTYAAYNTLPQSQKDEVAGLRVIHSFAAAQLRAHPDATEKERAAWEKVPSREHPLAWTRRDGRKSLLLGATAERVIDWPAREGRALLEGLEEWATQDKFVLRHQWRVGDLVVWDNTGMLHRALPFTPTSPRLMHRTTLVGVEPVA
jgi:alpha-ketoglutarate-dependent taurine dioxygenase